MYSINTVYVLELKTILYCLLSIIKEWFMKCKIIKITVYQQMSESYQLELAEMFIFEK